MLTKKESKKHPPEQHPFHQVVQQIQAESFGLWGFLAEVEELCAAVR